MNQKRILLLSFLVMILIWGIVSSEAITLESLIPKELPDGWILIDGPRIYTKKTLFQRINGQAELFFKYGFQKSIFAIYQNLKNPELQIELDIYDMGSVLQAFGIFSRFRNEDRSGGFGLESYLDDSSAFFYKGKYFVMFYATEPDPFILKQFSMLLSSKISDSSGPPREIDYFPKKGLKSGSIQYFPEGLLGRQFLKKGFQGTYIEKGEVKSKAKIEDKVEDEAKPGGKEFHLFLAVFRDAQEAMNHLRIFRNDLSKKGMVYSGSSHPFGPNSLKGEDPYQGKMIIVHKGTFLMGATGFIKEEAGEELLAESIRNVDRMR